MQSCSQEMEKSEATVNNSLVFAVNGKRFEIPAIHPSTTLLEFLRSQTPYKGAKLSCGEGLSLSLCLLVFRFGFSFFFDGYIYIFPVWRSAWF